MNMDKIIVRKLRFGSFMKITVLISTAMGVFFGVLMLIAGLLGGNVRASLGTTVLTGVAGGVASLFMGPIIFAIFGIVIGLLAYLPLLLVLKIFGGLSIGGNFEGVEAEEENEQTLSETDEM